MTHVTRAFAAVAVLGACALGGVAFAHGPAIVFPSFGGGGGGGSFFSQPSTPAPREHLTHRSYYEDDEPHISHHRHTDTASLVHRGGGPAVCVRLCDGAFFPAANSAGGDAACAAQCPDAPTALYTMTSDKIDDAYSLAGVPYSKLPVAKRFETSSDATCSCHRDGFASRAKQLLADPTLRKGDVVMTADGFRVYEGGYGKTGAQAFVALTQANDLSKDERATLTAMEKANAASPVLSAPAQLVERPKGNVTVDNGEPAPGH